MNFQNAFIGKREKPTDDELTAELGASRKLWDQLLSELALEQKLMVQEWNSYSAKAGWSLRLKSGGRNVLYLSPGRGGFRVSFAMGDKAIAAARNSGLPQRVITAINQAKKYAEGTAVRVDVKQAEDIAVVKKLAAAKLH